MSTSISAEIETTVVEALKEFGAEPHAVTREATFEELDVDSLDLAELAQIVQEKHGVTLKSADIENIKTVGEALDLIASRAA